MDVDELKAKYFERYIFVVKHNLEEAKDQKNVNCKLVGLIAEDIYPDRTTAFLGFCTLFLKISNDAEKKITQPLEEFREYNERIIEFCYHQLSLLRPQTESTVKTQQSLAAAIPLSKATLLLQLKDFEKKYRQDAKSFREWFDKTMKIRRSYKELRNKCQHNVEYYGRVLMSIREGNIPHSLKLDRSFLHSFDGKEPDPIYIEQKHITEDKILREIELNKSEVSGCEYQYDFYTRLINDSMIDNRAKEKLAYLASYSIDFLERGSESIHLNNRRSFGYHSYLQIPAEGVLGDKKFASEKVYFSVENIEKFLKEYFGYPSNQRIEHNETNTSSHNQKTRPIIQKNKKRKNLIVKETFEKLAKLKTNKNKSKKDIIYLVANKLDISFEAAKYNLYSKPKS